MAWRDFWGRGTMLVLGAVWWYAVLRLVLLPERAGVVEGAVAAGGWGLSLLPVHVVSATAAGVDSERRGRLGRTAEALAARLAAVLRRRGDGALRRGATRAWRRRRSGEGSDPS